jgi:hypothetical protein
MIYCKVSPKGKVHVAREETIHYTHNLGGYVFPICGLTCGPLIKSTEEEYKQNGCKGCKKAIIRRAIQKMQYGN